MESKFKYHHSEQQRLNDLYNAQVDLDSAREKMEHLKAGIANGGQFFLTVGKRGKKKVSYIALPMQVEKVAAEILRDYESYIEDVECDVR